VGLAETGIRPAKLVAVPLILAHRGVHRTQRENTIGAFRAARDLGVDGVELDVRRCADGQLVVHHDASIAGRPVAATPLAELPDYVATLADALGACVGMVVNVEIKRAKHPSGPALGAGGIASQVVELIAGTGRVADVIISCFDLATCRAARSRDSGVRVGWLLHRGRDVAAAVGVARDAHLHAIHPHYRAVTPDAVAAARAAGLGVNVWTVNRPRQMDAMIGLGVDAIITDDPASALTLVGRPPEGRSALA